MLSLFSSGGEGPGRGGRSLRLALHVLAFFRHAFKALFKPVCREQYLTVRLGISPHNPRKRLLSLIRPCFAYVNNMCTRFNNSGWVGGCQLECSSFPLVASALESGGMAAILPSIAGIELERAGIKAVKAAPLKTFGREICLAWNRGIRGSCGFGPR